MKKKFWSSELLKLERRKLTLKCSTFSNQKCLSYSPCRRWYFRWNAAGQECLKKFMRWRQVICCRIPTIQRSHSSARLELLEKEKKNDIFFSQSIIEMQFHKLRHAKTGKGTRSVFPPRFPPFDNAAVFEEELYLNFGQGALYQKFFLVFLFLVDIFLPKVNTYSFFYFCG